MSSHTFVQNNANTTQANPDHAEPAIDPELHARIKRVFSSQKTTAAALRLSSIDDRLAKLDRLKQTILQYQQAIIDAAMQDFGRSAAEAEFTEMMPVLMEIADHRKHLKSWLKPKKAAFSPMMAGTRSETRYEPRGRCLIIAPWNYPVTLALGPLVPAIASGNTVIIKTSEMAPHFSRVLVHIIQACFEENEVAIFEGDASVATALLDLPFDHMFFTGAPAIGRIVMTAAAKHLSSVTLELGGKSPVIIDETADIELAARTIAWGKYINNGQTCIAPDHVYVHASVECDFIDALRRAMDEWYGEGDAAKNSKLARIINGRHTSRVHRLLDDAVKRGAKILYGGTVKLDERFISPTLLGDTPPEAKIMEEEIFGPLLPLIRFASLDEVVAQINKAPKPLALYIWTRNDRHAEHIINNTSAGGTCVNHIAAHFLNQNLPFGGVNNSGQGSYHGEWGIRAFSHERAILKTQLFTARIFFPPRAEKMRKPLQWLMRKL